MKSVELLPAHLWICDECGRDNFVRCLEIDPESDRARSLAEEFGVEFTDGHFLAAPTEVECFHCGACFSVDAEELHP